MLRNDKRDDEPAELAALADGTLDPARRAEVEAHVAASPELTARLAEQRRALQLVRETGAEVTAPAGLRARVEAVTPRRRAPRLVWAGAAGIAAAAAAVAIVVFTTGSSQQQFTAALGPTGLVPGATGKATLTKTASGWRVELDASGLPRLDGGRFYEAWLKNAAGVLVPVGTFNEGRHVTLWAGVSPAKGFDTLTVTREESDGDQASSGEKVLVGRAG